MERKGIIVMLMILKYLFYLKLNASYLNILYILLMIEILNM